VSKKRGKPEGAALTAPSVGLGCDAALNTAFEKPKHSLYCHFLNLAVDSNGHLAHSKQGSVRINGGIFKR